MPTLVSDLATCISEVERTEGAEVWATDAERDAALEEIPAIAELAEADGPETPEPPMITAEDAEVKEAPAPVAEDL